MVDARYPWLSRWRMRQWNPRFRKTRNLGHPARGFKFAIEIVEIPMLHSVEHAYDGSKMTQEKKRKPVAVCTNCHAYSFSVEAINQPCRRLLSGNKKCKGIWGSALNVADWESCRSCKGTGEPTPDDAVANIDHTGICTSCRGTGWVFVREIP